MRSAAHEMAQAAGATALQSGAERARAKFSDLINQFMAQATASQRRHPEVFAAHYLAKKAGLKVNEKVYDDDPKMLAGAGRRGST